MSGPLTTAAMVTLAGCPAGCEGAHVGLPHISDCTPSSPPWCHAVLDADAHCTLRPLHAGPHVAGNGDWIVATWEPDPTRDWQHWGDGEGSATRKVAVVSWVHAEGPGGCITSSGFLWFPPHERDLLPAAAVAECQRAGAVDVPARVRLLHMDVPAQIAQDARSEASDVQERVTHWLEERLDQIEVEATPLVDVVVTPGDPEPAVTVVVQKQYTNRSGYDVDAAEPEPHAANAALRQMSREDVAALRDNDETSDAFVIDNGWLHGHRGGFYARFDGAAAVDWCDVPPALTEWLAWADRYRHLLGHPQG